MIETMQGVLSVFCVIYRYESGQYGEEVDTQNQKYLNLIMKSVNYRA
jgi:hypothetical protein